MNGTDRTLAEQVASWHRDFELSEELRFRFGVVSKYVRRRMRELHDRDPALRSRFPELKDFERHAIKVGSDFMSAERARDRRAAQLRLDEKTRSDSRRRMQKFTDYLTRK